MRHENHDNHEHGERAGGATDTALDPVCGTEVRADDVTTRSSVHEGVRYFFCSDHCKQRFLGEPARFVVSFVETK